MIIKYVNFPNKHLLNQIIFWEVFFLITIKFFGFKFLINFLRNIKVTSNNISINNLTKIEKVVSKKLHIDQCLVRASVVFLMLKKNAQKPKLSIGINSADSFASHCWVEINSDVIWFGENGSFKKIYDVL